MPCETSRQLPEHGGLFGSTVPRCFPCKCPGPRLVGLGGVPQLGGLQLLQPRCWDRAARPALGCLSNWLFIRLWPAEAERRGPWVAMAEQEALAEQEVCAMRHWEVPP